MNYRAFHLFGAAYPTDKALENAKLHIGEVDADGNLVRILCGKPKMEHVCDDGSDMPVSNGDCPSCIRKYKKIRP